MSWIRAERSAAIAADPWACFEAIARFEAYPEWQGMVSAVTVHERDEQGRGRVVETEATTAIRQVRYVMRYDYDPPARIHWRQLSGDLRDLEGEYRFEAIGDGRTQATYRLAVQPGPRLATLMRGPLFERLKDYLLDNSLRELRARVE